MQAFYDFFSASPRFKSGSKVVCRGDGAQNLTYLTNAIILGGLLSLVWKKRLLLIR